MIGELFAGEVDVVVVDGVCVVPPVAACVVLEALPLPPLCTTVVTITTVWVVPPLLGVVLAGLLAPPLLVAVVASLPLPPVDEAGMLVVAVGEAPPVPSGGGWTVVVFAPAVLAAVVALLVAPPVPEGSGSMQVSAKHTRPLAQVSLLKHAQRFSPTGQEFSGPVLAESHAPSDMTLASTLRPRVNETG